MCSDPSACFSEMGPEVQMCSASCSRSGRAILGPAYMLQIRLAYTWGRHMLLACVDLSSSGDSTKLTDPPLHCRIWFKQQKTCVIFIDNHETPGWVNFGSIQRCYIFARIQVQPFIKYKYEFKGLYCKQVYQFTRQNRFSLIPLVTPPRHRYPWTPKGASTSNTDSWLWILEFFKWKLTFGFQSNEAVKARENSGVVSLSFAGVDKADQLVGYVYTIVDSIDTGRPFPRYTAMLLLCTLVLLNPKSIILDANALLFQFYISSRLANSHWARCWSLPIACNSCGCLSFIESLSNFSFVWIWQEPLGQMLVSSHSMQLLWMLLLFRKPFQFQLCLNLTRASTLQWAWCWSSPPIACSSCGCFSSISHVQQWQFQAP